MIGVYETSHRLQCRPQHAKKLAVNTAYSTNDSDASKSARRRRNDVDYVASDDDDDDEIAAFSAAAAAAESASSRRNAVDAIISLVRPDRLGYSQIHL